MHTKTKTRRFSTLLVVACVPLLAGGCIGYFRQAPDHFEFNSKDEMVRLQSLNPEAGKNRKVVAGLDGAAATEVNKSYVKGFERNTSTKATESFVGLTGISN